MTKLLSVLLVAILSFGILVSCGNNEDPSSTQTSSSTEQTDTDNSKENEKTNIKISVLNGTTGFGIVHLMSQNEANLTSNQYTIDVETDATKIVSALIAGDIDMAALPTNAAANVYNKSNGKVQVLAINTLGVLYLLDKNGQVASIDDLKSIDTKIYVPAQNPRFITEYILTSNGISADKIDSTTYSTPAALQSAVVAGQVELAVLPQPVVTAAIAGANKAGFKYSISLNLTEEWDKIPNSEKLVQGCLVVRKEFAENNKEAVGAFLTEYEQSINYLNNNPKEASALIVKYGIFANATVAENAIPKCNITFMKGEEMKSAMSAFIKVMFDIAPASVGNKLPSSDFYYIP